MHRLARLARLGTFAAVALFSCAAFVAPNSVKETTTTTGTGALSLAGAASGFVDFDSQLDTGDTTWYTVYDASGNIEMGVGTFTAGTPDTLARTTLLWSTTGAAINFGAGTKTVLAGLPGDAVESLLDPGASNGFVRRTGTNTYTTNTGPSTDDTVFIGTGNGTTSWVTLPDCDAGLYRYDTGTNTFSCATDTGRVVQTTDVTTTSDTVYSAASGLNIEVAASTKYLIECWFITSTAVGTTGLQLQIQGPASPTSMNRIRSFYNNSTTAITSIAATSFNTSANDDTAGGSCSANRCINHVLITLVNGANAGTIQFAVQSEIAASNVTLHAGSYCDHRTY